MKQMKLKTVAIATFAQRDWLQSGHRLEDRKWRALYLPVKTS